MDQKSNKSRLTQKQQCFLNIIRKNNEALVDDVLHLAKNDRSSARDTLNRLVRMGYLKKRSVKVTVTPLNPFNPFGRHNQKVSKYLLTDPPPEQV